MHPDVLVLDEATAQLDPMGTREILSIVQALNQRHGMTIVMATNKGDEVAEFCDWVLVLHQAELIAQGRPRDVFADADLLAQVMIRTSQVSQLAMYLAERSVCLSNFPTTLDEGRREIWRLVKGAT
jgi:energy-coupling factor transporter ATP-binding protein EcfA2